MSNKELHRKSEIESVLEKRESQKKAALKLGISERHFRRILQRYRKESLAGIVSKKRGVPSNRRLSQDIREVVEAFIREPLMLGFGPTLLAEKLEEYKGIRLSKETLRKTMIQAGVWKAKVKKKVEPHYARPRMEHRGELVQIDGSEHAWLEDRGPKACLLVFVDDATSELLEAEFVPEESFFSYGNLVQRYFKTHGMPKAFYSDRFSVFRVNRKDNLSYEPVTQFQRALSVLNVGLICANSPQAKGRVERANQTLQDRLVKEMRLSRINSYAEANQEVLITCNADGCVSAWFDGKQLELELLEQRPKQTEIASSKSSEAKSLPPAYDHPWRTYGKKINGKPLLTTMLTEQDISI